MKNEYVEELHAFLNDERKKPNIIVMPDFFIDRFISLKFDVETLLTYLQTVARRKGGSIDGAIQKEFRGGNAINTASALSALGAKVTPIVCTDILGLQLIKHCFNSQEIDLSHVKILDEASLTTAIELNDRKSRVNIMLRDVGSLADFSPQHLDDQDYAAIEKADYVCLFNWAGTRRFGTKLAQTIFERTKTKGKGKTYYDTADPTPNKAEIPILMKTVLQGKCVDILSVNENEAICYAAQLSNIADEFKKRLALEEAAKKSARMLSTCLSSRIDLHTTTCSGSFAGKRETVVPAFKVQVLRATGAGDAWNAGNILGDAYGLSDGCRLTLANAVAAFYISNPKGAHPTRKQLAEVLDESEKKSVL